MFHIYSESHSNYTVQKNIIIIIKYVYYLVLYGWPVKVN